MNCLASFAYLPTEWAKSFSFSQMFSINSVSGCRSKGMVADQGFVYASGRR